MMVTLPAEGGEKNHQPELSGMLSRLEQKKREKRLLGLFQGQGT